MFTIDTESGFKDVVFITSSYGLGETVVQGAVNPDEFYVHKPMLEAGKLPIIRRNLGSKLIQMVFAARREAGRLGASALVKTVDVPLRAAQPLLADRRGSDRAGALRASSIEKHYGRPMDIEWGKDGVDGQLYILQARPETVKSQQQGKAEHALQAQGQRAMCSPRAAPSARRSAPGRCGGSQHRRDGHACSRATCWSPT